MLYARISDGVVAEIINLPEGVELEDAYHPDIASSMVACDEKVREGWIYDGKIFAEPVIPPPSKEQLAAHANFKQWVLATGGFTVGSLTFATDATSQSLITGKALRLQQAGAPESVNWQFSSGYSEIASADFISSSIKIADFVQATFDALQTVLSGVEDGTITTIEEVDAATWPSNHG